MLGTLFIDWPGKKQQHKNTSGFSDSFAKTIKPKQAEVGDGHNNISNMLIFTYLSALLVFPGWFLPTFVPLFKHFL